MISNTMMLMSWGWQEWVVALLVVICVVRLVCSIRTFLQRAKKNDNPCANCASGCELKNQLNKKSPQCKDYTPSDKKKCCG